MGDRGTNRRLWLRLALGSAALALSCGHETIDLFGATGGQGGAEPIPSGSAPPDRDASPGDGQTPGATGGAPTFGGAPNPGVEGGSPGLGGSGGRPPPPSTGGSGVVDIPSTGGSGGVGGPMPPPTGGFSWGGEAPGFGGGPIGYAGEGPFWGGPGSPCRESRDCDRELYCDPAALVCVPGCSSGQDCVEPRPICAMEGLLAGRCVECTGDQHCDQATPARPWCLFYAGVCVECYRDEDCDPPARFCHPSKYTCAECLTSQHCQEGWHCDPMAMMCVQW